MYREYTVKTHMTYYSLPVRESETEKDIVPKLSAEFLSLDHISRKVASLVKPVLGFN